MLKKLLVGAVVSTISGLVVKNVKGKEKEDTITFDEYINNIQKQSQFLEDTVNNMSKENKEIEKIVEQMNENLDKMIEEKKKENQEYFNNPKEYIDNQIKELQQLKEDLERFEKECPEEYYEMFGKEDYSEYDNVVSLNNYKNKRL